MPCNDSRRLYGLLLKGEATSAEYVAALRAEARESVKRLRLGRRGDRPAGSVTEPGGATISEDQGRSLDPMDEIRAGQPFAEWKPAPVDPLPGFQAGEKP